MRLSNRGTKLKVLTLALAGVALTVPLAFGHGGANKFGSKLTRDTQPSNGAPGLTCEPKASEKCTFIMNEAYAPPNPDGKQKAPKDGTIDKVELIAATSGEFKLQVAKVKNGKAKIVKNGGRIAYDGQSGNGSHYKIEKFNVDIPIKKGQYLAARAKKISFVRCSSGGDNTLIYQPALKKGKPFASTSGSDGCWMLLEAFYK